MLTPATLGSQAELNVQNGLGLLLKLTANTPHLQNFGWQSSKAPIQLPMTLIDIKIWNSYQFKTSKHEGYATKQIVKIGLWAASTGITNQTTS